MKKGDILYSNQADVNFYKVIDVSKTGKSVTVIALEKKVNWTNSVCGEAMPVDVRNGAYEEIKRRVKIGYSGEFIDIETRAYKAAWLWNGKPVTF